jgi:hypothetical protein
MDMLKQNRIEAARAAYQAADNEWHAALASTFGAKDVDMRYRKEGKTNPACRALYAARTEAYIELDAALLAAKNGSEA